MELGLKARHFRRGTQISELEGAAMVKMGFARSKALRAERRHGVALQIEATLAGLLLGRQESSSEVIVKYCDDLVADGFDVIIGSSYEWDEAKIVLKSVGAALAQTIREKISAVEKAVLDARMKTSSKYFHHGSSESQLVMSGRIVIVAVKGDIRGERHFHWRTPPYEHSQMHRYPPCDSRFL